tara:strand:+ start:299 stop:517 length:219 start_codon:yes stop_codon:yes gene_type:complete
MAGTKNKNRKYYQNLNNTDDKKHKKLFIVRYQDLSQEEIHNDGPYTDEAVASEKLSALLKRGVCSWVVSYNG